MDKIQPIEVLKVTTPEGDSFIVQENEIIIIRKKTGESMIVKILGTSKTYIYFQKINLEDPDLKTLDEKQIIRITDIHEIEQ